MKNPLQLELELKIKKANRYLTSKEYSHAIEQYTQGLSIYEENRKFNETVSQQFQSLLYSLRAHTYSLNFKGQCAEEDFARSLSINPYNSVTLSRRAKHYMKVVVYKKHQAKKFSYAIQDIDKALLYDPENLSYLALLNSIQNYLHDMEDQEQKLHLTELILSVKQRFKIKNITQSNSSEDQENDEEMLINFAKLKKIDRVSVKLNSSIFNKRKSVIEFKQDEVMEYEKDDETNQTERDKNVVSEKEIIEKLQEQDHQLNELDHEDLQSNNLHEKFSQKIVLKKSHQKGRKSILRKSILSSQNDGKFINLAKQSSFHNRSSISAASIKNIDGKIICHQRQKIKFRPSIVRSDIQIAQTIQQVQKQHKSPISSRKSCLRNSKRFQNNQIDELVQKVQVKRTSSFLNIKNIDGLYKRNQKSQSQNDQKQKIQSESSQESDDENDQHNIFGKKKQKQVLHYIESLSGAEQKQNVNNKTTGKKSILRKDSILGSANWKSQKKKSVLFKTS